MRIPKKRLILAVTVIVVLGAAGGIVQWRRTRHHAAPTTKAEPVITFSTDKPDESQKNADSYNWKGAADEPKKIRISQYNVDAYVQKAGVDQHNQVAVPNNVHLASWFSESVKPGEKGLSIIDGHVSGPTTDGVFKNIMKFTAGGTFEIELGSGKVLTYKVLKVDTVPTAEAASILFSQDPNVASQLNLITCTGTYVKADKAFDKRVIVSAVLQ